METRQKKTWLTNRDHVGLTVGHAEGSRGRRLGEFTEVAVDRALMSQKPGLYSGGAGELSGVVRGKSQVRETSRQSLVTTLYGLTRV